VALNLLDMAGGEAFDIPSIAFERAPGKQSTTMHQPTKRQEFNEEIATRTRIKRDLKTRQPRLQTTLHLKGLLGKVPRESVWLFAKGKRACSKAAVLATSAANALAMLHS
jgi:hypothetical protein